MKTPRVSVVLPIYNAEHFVGGVLESILSQTFTDFEIIALDDGSKDGSARIIKDYASIDKRIKYFHQPNAGAKALGETINKGIELAQADLIARADADDPWFYNKLAQQVAFLDQHPKHVLIGGGTEIMDNDGHYSWTLLNPMDDEDNRRSLCLYTTFAHGSVVFRKAAWEQAGKYRNVAFVEDLDLWHRMTELGQIANLPVAVFHYRLSEGGISLTNKAEQVAAVHTAGREYWRSHTPEVYSRKKLRDKLIRIKKHTRPQDYGNLAIPFLQDNLTIAVKFAKWDRSYLKAMHQFWNVATSSKLGSKYAVKKLLHK
jgi:glycosyltransferase involved in cell wall biosynthesis